MSDKKIKVCVVALNAYGAYVPSSGSGMGGGIGYRSSSVARQLAKDKNLEVSAMIGVRSSNMAGHPTVVDNVQIVFLDDRPKLWDRLSDNLHRNLRLVLDSLKKMDCFPWLRLVRYGGKMFLRIPVAIVWGLYQLVFPANRRSACFNRSFAEHQADVYLFFAESRVIADSVATCHLLNHKAIWMITHDCNLDSMYELDKPVSRIRYFEPTASAWRYVITKSDAIVAQTAWQQSTLRERFGRESQIIHNPIDLDNRTQLRYAGLSDRYIFWVGGSNVIKRPELCLALAKRLPHVPFVMVMNRSDMTIHDKILSQLPDNVRVIEQVPVDQIESIFCHATAYLSTSSGEGFPNVFLQAGKYQVPIASLTVDPNEMLTTHGGGFWANDDMDALANELKKMWDDEPYRQKLGQNALNYVKEYHDLEKNVGKLKSIILELAGAPTSEQPKP